MLSACASGDEQPENGAGEQLLGEGHAQPRIRDAWPDHSFSRSSNFCTLPVDVFGSCSTSSTVFGALNRAIRLFTCSISSSGVALCPSTSTTNALGRSPHCSSGTP